MSVAEAAASCQADEATSQPPPAPGGRMPAQAAPTWRMAGCMRYCTLSILTGAPCCCSRSNRERSIWTCGQWAQSGRPAGKAAAVRGGQRQRQR